MAFVNHIVEPVLSAALNTLWQAAVLAVLVWLILRSIPRMNASTRHAVWWVSLAALLLLPAASSLIQHRHPARVMDARITISSLPDIASPAARLPKNDFTPVKVRAGWFPELALGLWLAIALVQLIRIVWSYSYLRGVRWRSRPASLEMQTAFGTRLAQCRIRQPIRLLVSSEIASPMAAGFLRPAVILPESLSGAFEESELDYVLLHELAHLARGDNWTNLAGRLAAAFVALHPVALWILRRIERERELACDDWVVSFTGQARPYAQTLARLFEVCATRRRVLLATGMAGSASQLGERIEGLLRGRDFAPRASFFRVALCALFALALSAAGTLAPRWIAFARDAQSAPQAPSSEPARPAPRAPKASRPSPVPVAPQAARPSGAEVSAPANGGLMATLSAAGYGELSVDEIITLKNAGVTPAFILGMRESGWGKPAAGQLIQLWQNGVRPDYAGLMGAAGLKDLTLNDVVRMRQHGVNPEFVDRMHALGFGPFNAQEAIDLSSHGVSLETLRALKEAGLGDASVPEIVKAQNSGLREADVRAAKRFSSRLTLEQIIKLKQGGVL